jgi:hypothetical protein
MYFRNSPATGFAPTGEQARRERLSTQYRKASTVAGRREETKHGIYLRLKDGTRLLAQEFRWRKAPGQNQNAVEA